MCLWGKGAMDKLYGYLNQRISFRDIPYLLIETMCLMMLKLYMNSNGVCCVFGKQQPVDFKIKGKKKNETN